MTRNDKFVYSFFSRLLNSSCCFSLHSFFGFILFSWPSLFPPPQKKTLISSLLSNVFMYKINLNRLRNLLNQHRAYHCKSTRPPRRAITDFTRFAKSIALSPSFLYIGGRYHTSQTIAQLDIIMYKYCIIEYRLLFQNASPNLGSYWAYKN